MKFDILKPQVTCGKGRRTAQADCVFPAVGEATIHDKLFLACDGVGDNETGYQASNCFCQTVSDLFFQETCPDEPLTDEFFDSVLRRAQEAMRQQCPDSQGTRFAMLYLHRHGCLAAHVGSARVYHFRPKERLMLYRSADDNRLFDIHAENPVEPVKAYITQVQYGDYFVLTTEGASAVLSEQRLMDILCEPGNDAAKMVKIVKELSGCDDNHSVILVHVSGVMNEAMDEQLPDNERQLMAAVALAASAKSAAETEDNPPTAQSRVSESGKAQETGRHETRRPQERPVAEEPPRRQRQEEEGEEKGGFPVGLVTALCIVALAIAAWFWMRQSTNRDEEEVPAVEVKKDTVKKDTINIMKSEKPKALNVLDENKPKEEKKEGKSSAESERKNSESTDSTGHRPVDYPLPEGGVTAPADDAVNSGAERPVKPAEDVTPTPPANPQPSNNQPANASQGTGNSGSVTPRPVIPEDE